VEIAGKTEPQTDIVVNRLVGTLFTMDDVTLCYRLFLGSTTVVYDSCNKEAVNRNP